MEAHGDGGCGSGSILQGTTADSALLATSRGLSCLYTFLYLCLLLFGLALASMPSPSLYRLYTPLSHSRGSKDHSWRLTRPSMQLPNYFIFVPDPKVPNAHA